MPWEGDVAAGDSSSPVRAGEQRPETGCHAPRAKDLGLGKDGHQGGPGSHLDQNVLGLLRRDLSGLDFGPLG